MGAEMVRPEAEDAMNTLTADVTAAGGLGLRGGVSTPNRGMRLSGGDAFWSGFKVKST